MPGFPADRLAFLKQCSARPVCLASPSRVSLEREAAVSGRKVPRSVPGPSDSLEGPSPQQPCVPSHPRAELASLGFLESGSGPGRLRHLEDVTDVVEDWGPFDLVYGATPPLGHTCYRPPGWFLFQFCRLLQYARPPPGSPRPFFWMFVDNLVLSQEDVAAAARFLETEPVTVPDVRGGTLQDAVRVWSNVPAVRSPRLFLLLSSLQAGVAYIQEKEVRAMVGSNVELGCVSPEEGSFDLNDLFVYWQISERNTVVTYYLPQNSSTTHVDSHYRSRAWLSLDSMRRGDFSLHLFNVTPQDGQKFHCLVFRKSLEMKQVLQTVVTLHVAANYSMPVVSTPSGPLQDELTFTCTSTNGYPRPNVYWINKTDNSLLDAALQNSTVSLNDRGLYDVVSVLRIGWTPNVNVGCCIENVLLHQNLTVSSQAEAFTGTQDKIIEKSGLTPQEQTTILYVVAGCVAVAVVAAGWMCWKKRCPQGHYAGAQAARPEPELAGESARTPRGPGRPGHCPSQTCADPSDGLGFPSRRSPDAR
nr:ICOS ligand-like isoform X2 [Microcebus murinus]